MLDPSTFHKSITEDLVVEAYERYCQTLDNPGFCITCGAENGGTEPDAEENECEICGSPTVVGAEQLLLYLVA